MAEASFQFDHELRKHLSTLLASGESHATNARAFDHLPAALHGKKAAGIEHSPWQLLEHIHIAQADILDFCVNPLYQPPTWPDDYWPSFEEPPDRGAWEGSRRGFFSDLEAMTALVVDPARNLFAPIPWGKGKTLLREALLVADHNSYHIGQMILLRKALGAWPG